MRLIFNYLITFLGVFFKGKITLMLCVLSLFFNNVSYAQTLNELEQSLNSSDEADKAYIYNQIAELYLTTSVDKAIESAQRSIVFSKKYNNVQELAMANLTLADAYKITKKNTSAINCLSIAAQQFVQLKETKNLSIVYKKLSDLYITEQNYEQAIKTNELAQKLFIQNNDKKGLASCFLTLGDLSFKLEKYQDALTNYNKALTYSQDDKDFKLQAKILARIGNTQSNYGDFKNANLTLQKALVLATSNNMKLDVDAITKSLAVVDNNATNFNKSQTTFNKVKTEELQNQTGVLQDQTNQLIKLNNLSITEIEKLSVEKQVVAFKLKTKQDELIRTQMEADNRAKQISLLKTEAKLKEVKLNEQKLIILIISLSLFFLALLVIIIIRNLRITHKQKAIIEKQKQVVEEKHQLIISGINAASLIQEASLPPPKILNQLFTDYFILYKPKDIVSGDFYWVKDLGESILVAVVDCTGHGVPGAFMALHGYNLLERIVAEKKVVELDAILNELNIAIVNAMRAETDVMYVKNGMDMAIIKLHKAKRMVEYSGAKNDLYLVRDGVLNEIKSDRMSIGHIFDATFTVKQQELKSNDMLFLFTDGYKDQKGGIKDGRFMVNQFKETLQTISKKNSAEQKEILENTFKDWKNNNEQTDDVCVVGIRITN